MLRTFLQINRQIYGCVSEGACTVLLCTILRHYPRIIGWAASSLHYNCSSQVGWHKIMLRKHNISNERFTRQPRIVLSIAVFAILLGPADSARILGIFPMAFRSHFALSKSIMDSLHAAGHHITMISPFPSSEKIDNFTYTDSRDNTVMYVGKHTISDVRTMTKKELAEMTTTMDVHHCYSVIKLPEIQEALKSPKKLYDVMFVEIVIAYDCYLPIAEKLGIPVIGTLSISSYTLADSIIGIPNNPGFTPNVASVTGGELSILDRAQNLWSNFISHYIYWTRTRESIEELYRQYFTEDLLNKKDISLIFINNHASWLPRALPPNAIDIAGVQLKPAKPLPKDLQKFIDEAPRGVILFTFGTTMNGSSLAVDKRRALLAAFASIPQRVIWKYEEQIDDLPQNVLISSWLPQRDILEHKNVIAFISHCGLGGVLEAISTGTPIVAIPVCGDQVSNAAALLRRGIAVEINLDTMTEDTVRNALDLVVNDTSYFRRMQVISSAFKDRPMSPQESIVYWTEYVIRHNGTSHLNVFEKDVPFHQFLMLDIIVSALIIVILLIYVIYSVSTKIYYFAQRLKSTSMKKNE